ncbi:hypothetical protein [Mesorhizobium sp. Mes31]|nr:hypothetical protein [Mesorhizobium sp. Mes31]
MPARFGEAENAVSPASEGASHVNGALPAVDGGNSLRERKR